MRRLALLALLLLMALLWRPGAAAAVQITRVTGPSGVEAWLVEDHSLPVIALEFAFENGSALDPPEKAGLANLAMDLLDEGAGDLDSSAYKARLEDLAIQLAFNANPDSVNGSLRTLSENADAAFDLLRLALTSPRFDASAVERVKVQLDAELRQEAEEPGSIAGRAWWQSAFPDHPYGHRVKGTVASVAKIDADDLHRFVAERFGRDRLVIGVVGDMAPERLKGLLDKTFGPLPAASAPGPVPETAAVDQGTLLLVRKPIPQSVITFGERGIERSDPDWYAAVVMNQILAGGGLTSRLAREVREKRGLAYGIGAGVVALRHTGVILGRVATRNGGVEDTLKVLRDEWRRYRDEGPTEAEVAAAKTYLIGSFPLSLDSTGRVAGLLVSMQEDKLGIDYLDRRSALLGKVTRADVQRVARRLLDPDTLRIVVVGDPKTLVGAHEIEPAG
ncbi:MAG TPA: pitrilysin family protein, partial [Stellaceae bacterium]|nr:pitrilysin family protein [Stellaceae bacterium]